MADNDVLKTAMKSGKVADVRKLVDVALAEGAAAQEILNKGLFEAMGEVGQRFKRNEVFVPEVPVAARAMKAGTEVLKTRLGKAGVVAVCAVWLTGCVTGWKTEKCADVAEPTVLEEGWKQVGTLEVADVTRGQRLAFDLGSKAVDAVRLEIRGKVDGHAQLTVCEPCSPQTAAFPSTLVSGDVCAVIKQVHSACTLTVDYAPDGVRSGRLTVRAWVRATPFK
jgi:hypothetical protein